MGAAPNWLRRMPSGPGSPAIRFLITCPWQRTDASAFGSHGAAIDFESVLLVLLDSAKRLTSSTTAVIVCVPLGMVYAPPLVPMVTDAPAARGPATAPHVCCTPSTEY